MKQVSLTKGLCALVDDEDFEKIDRYKWTSDIRDEQRIYARRNDNGKKILMHRLILGINDSNILVDHIDRNGLNNQKVNLRIANKSQNNANRRSKINASSKYLGVSWSNKYQKWISQIKKDKKVYFLGRFESEKEAALIYNQSALKFHGEFASVNIIN